MEQRLRTLEQAFKTPLAASQDVKMTVHGSPEELDFLLPKDAQDQNHNTSTKPSGAPPSVSSPKWSYGRSPRSPRFDSAMSPKISPQVPGAHTKEVFLTPGITKENLHQAVDDVASAVAMGSALFKKRMASEGVKTSRKDEATVGLDLLEVEVKDSTDSSNVKTMKVSGLQEGSFVAALNCVAPGDCLVAVDNFNTCNKRLEEVEAMLSGVEGSTVLGSFYRIESGIYFEIPMLRLDMQKASQQTRGTTHFANSPAADDMLSKLKVNGVRLAQMSAIEFGVGVSVAKVYDRIQQVDQFTDGGERVPYTVKPEESRVYDMEGHGQRVQAMKTELFPTVEESPNVAQGVMVQQASDSIPTESMDIKLLSGEVLTEDMTIESLATQLKLTLSMLETSIIKEAEAKNETEKYKRLLAEQKEIVAVSASKREALEQEWRDSAKVATNASKEQSEVIEYQKERIVQMQDEMKHMKVKMESIIESYSRQRKANLALEKKTAEQEGVLKEHQEVLEKARVEHSDRKLSGEDLLKRASQLESDLAAWKDAHAKAADKVAALTNTTLDQTAEIFRLNEIVIRLTRENQEQTAILKTQEQQQFPEFMVPVV